MAVCRAFISTSSWRVCCITLRSADWETSLDRPSSGGPVLAPEGCPPWRGFFASRCSGRPLAPSPPPMEGYPARSFCAAARRFCGQLAPCRPPEGYPTRSFCAAAPRFCGQLALCRPLAEGHPTRSFCAAARRFCGQLAPCRPPEGYPTGNFCAAAPRFCGQLAPCRPAAQYCCNSAVSAAPGISQAYASEGESSA